MVKLTIATLVFIFGVASSATLQDVFNWKEISYDWKNDQHRENAIHAGEYIPENNLPLGMARWKNKLFVTVPRWKAGVASSLNYITVDSNELSPAFIPYPSWEANTLPKDHSDQKPIASVFRVAVDACDRLWVMDTGLADILGSPKVYSKPSLLIFDLNTDELIKRCELKADDLKEDSFFANVIVDTTKDTCDDAYAYIPDLGAYGVVVYSFKDNDSWRVKHHFFHFDPLAGEYRVGGIDFQWTDGVFGIALSKTHENGFRTAYFHALSSTKEFSVPTEILRNKTLALDPHTFHKYKLEGERGEKTQASASSLDEKTDVLFFTQVNKNGVACWNTKKPLNPKNFGLIAKDDEKLIFPNHLTTDEEDYLWVLSDKMPKFIYDTLDPNSVNYRILKIKIADAIKGSVCV